MTIDPSTNALLRLRAFELAGSHTSDGLTMMQDAEQIERAILLGFMPKPGSIDSTLSTALREEAHRTTVRDTRKESLVEGYTLARETMLEVLDKHIALRPQRRKDGSSMLGTELNTKQLTLVRDFIASFNGDRDF